MSGEAVWSYYKEQPHYNKITYLNEHRDKVEERNDRVRREREGKVCVCVCEKEGEREQSRGSSE